MVDEVALAVAEEVVEVSWSVRCLSFITPVADILCLHRAGGFGGDRGGRGGFGGGRGGDRGGRGGGRGRGAPRGGPRTGGSVPFAGKKMTFE